MRPDPEFESFFCGHYDALVRSLAVITGDHEVAADCVQDAFIRAHARWGRVRRLDDPAAWVRRVAINRSRDMHRSDARRRRREDSFETSRGGSSAIDIGEDGTDDELEKLLRRLTPRQRAVATLYYLDDLPVADVAAGLGLSRGSVKFHLHRARRALRSILELEGAQHA